MLQERVPLDFEQFCAIFYNVERTQEFTCNGLFQEDFDSLIEKIKRDEYNLYLRRFQIGLE